MATLIWVTALLMMLQQFQQWFVGSEYLRRLKKAFDAKNIEIPFSHRTLDMGEASAPFKLANPIHHTARHMVHPTP